MTLEFAKVEAQRRTDALGLPHYILGSRWMPSEYIISRTVYAGYTVVETVTLQQVQCGCCGRMVDRDHRCQYNNSI